MTGSGVPPEPSASQGDVPPPEPTVLPWGLLSWLGGWLGGILLFWLAQRIGTWASPHKALHVLNALDSLDHRLLASFQRLNPLHISQLFYNYFRGDDSMPLRPLYPGQVLPAPEHHPHWNWNPFAGLWYVFWRLLDDGDITTKVAGLVALRLGWLFASDLCKPPAPWPLTWGNSPRERRDKPWVPEREAMPGAVALLTPVCGSCVMWVMQMVMLLLLGVLHGLIHGLFIVLTSLIIAVPAAIQAVFEHGIHTGVHKSAHRAGHWFSRRPAGKTTSGHGGP